MNYLTQNLFIIFASCLTTIYFVPIVNKIGFKLGFIDKPNKRKQHSSALVRIGGLAIIIGFYISLIFTYFTINYETKILLTSYSVQIFPLLLISFLMFLIGFIDDIFDLSPFSRLSLQILLAYIGTSNGIIISDVEISTFSNTFFIFSIPIFISNAISIIWLSGVTNAINWIDGLDGLAAGLGLISSLSLAIYNFKIDQPLISLLSASLAGTCLGFLRYNFKNASILMGDGGSYFIGFLLAAITLKSYKVETGLLSIIPLFLFLSVPIVDMTFVIFGRIMSKKSPFKPDRRHLHHRLLNLGFNQNNTVLIIYLLNMITSIIGLTAF